MNTAEDIRHLLEIALKMAREGRYEHLAYLIAMAVEQAEADAAEG